MAELQYAEELRKEISELNRRLDDARSSLSQIEAKSSSPPAPLQPPPSGLSIPHHLLLLADSALPLGSFAYSSGLESYIAHHKPLPRGITPLRSFHRFLSLSLASLTSTTLPYVLHAHRYPDQLEVLDNNLDASTLCTVARRASVAQGLALLNVWERAFRDADADLNTACKTSPEDGKDKADATARRHQQAHAALAHFSQHLKLSFDCPDPEEAANGHLPPLWGVVCAALCIKITDTAYVFLLTHVKAILSAAVRASAIGPYQAQAILAGQEVQELIWRRMNQEWETVPENSAQVVPIMDLWVGRHELLYSRIFNS